MGTPTIYGPSYSTYVRTARLVLEEKGAEYRLEPVNLLAGESHAAAHMARQPFGKVPGFEHDGFSIYETSAIARYCDQAFPGPKLQPTDARQAARMNQIIGVVDSYAYGSILGKLVWQRLVTPMTGGTADEAVIEGSKPMVRLCLSEFERLKGGDPWLAGPALSLADLFVAPILAYLSMTPDAGALLEPTPGLRRWFDAIAKRPSMEKTPPQF